MRGMKHLLILYHSRTGGTRQMAEAAASGAAREAGVTVRLLPAAEATPGDLLPADGYLFAAPEMLGSVSGVMKDCFDRCYYPLLGRLEGRPHGLMVCAGSDGQGAVRQMQRIVTGWRLREVAPPLVVCVHAQAPEAILAEKQLAAEDRAACAELGESFAAGLAMGVF